MSSHYNWKETPEGYQFSTLQGLDYLVYFTEFFLDNNEGGEQVPVFSIGITCKQGDSFNINRKDALIGETIISIICDYFAKNSDESILYFCMTDGNQRERRITFGRWFHQHQDLGFEKHDCDQKYAKDGIFASIIVNENNPKKESHIKSFHFTLDSWFNQASSRSTD